MTTKPDDGGPAFPFEYLAHDGSLHPPEKMVHAGMTLRDYFAGQALNGLTHELAIQLSDGSTTAYDSIAEIAYLVADSMLKARQS